MAESLTWWGHDAVHTLELEAGNHTTDSYINELSVTEQRIVITKDADFVNSFLLAGVPFKLLLESTGNISNKELLTLFEKNISIIEMAYEKHRYVEVTRTSLIEHR